MISGAQFSVTLSLKMRIFVFLTKLKKRIEIESLLTAYSVGPIECLLLMSS